ncbi:hypothetical protein B0T10DRAFT_580986 [Thelonectria olida]|uniref:Uncharacterized protein n=1 Tax=Thelonectria olida TaxID=1576542 RepID=A0A9P8VXQ1_9HYPO|nr:hypothetical protein B0T10DRAFT_580986 [Thelonectria olida]
MSRIPNTPSRTFNIRTVGLFKKGNTLFNLLHPRVAIIVQPDCGMDVGNTRAYASHNEREWPELHAFLENAGIRAVGPDHFDTVADRLSEQSTCSGSSVTPPRMASSESSQSDERLLALAASTSERQSPEPRQGTPFPDMPPILPNPSISEPVFHLPKSSHTDSLTGDGKAGSQARNGNAISRDQKMRAASHEFTRPRDIAHYTRKRKAPLTMGQRAIVGR